MHPDQRAKISLEKKISQQSARAALWKCVSAGECAKVHTKPLQQPSKEGTREQKCGVWKLPLQSCGAEKYRKCMQTNILCAEGKVYFARKAPWGLVNIQRDPLKWNKEITKCAKLNRARLATRMQIFFSPRAQQLPHAVDLLNEVVFVEISLGCWPAWNLIWSKIMTNELVPHKVRHVIGLVCILSIQN